MPVKEGMRDRLRREADADRQALGMAPLGPFRLALPQPGDPTPAGATQGGVEIPPASAPPDPGTPPSGDTPAGESGAPAEVPPQPPPSDPPAPPAPDARAEATWEKRYGDLRAIVGPVQQENGAMRRDILRLTEEKAALVAEVSTLKGQLEQREAAASAGQSDTRAQRLESLKTLYPEVAEEMAMLRAEIEKRNAAPKGPEAPVEPAAPVTPGAPTVPADAISEVLAVHPDARELVVLDSAQMPTEKSAPFWAWMNSLPQHLQAEYRPYILQTRAYPGAAAIRVLSEFKAFRAAAAAPPPAPKPSDRSTPQGRTTVVDTGRGGAVKATETDLNEYRRTLHKMTSAQKEEKRAWFRASGLM